MTPTTYTAVWIRKVLRDPVFNDAMIPTPEIARNPSAPHEEYERTDGMKETAVKKTISVQLKNFLYHGKTVKPHGCSFT